MEHTKAVRSKKKRVQPILFDLSINGRSFNVIATPFIVATGEDLYRVSYNNGPVHVFGWDDGLNRFAETDLQADIIPPIIEMAIAERLNGVASEMQDAA